ncbi:transmembrane protein 221 [Varanus komodoensis]|uniref:transmembrane protein 221 n=1 Tax=Varanus komodoensis TaxID=61221 RepID=UPI001CF7AA67|nr:transmembrane protein 221 [Varanus komodoensis]
MLAPYGQRALGALILFGTVAGVMAVLASLLIFQIQAGGRAGPAGGGGGGLPEDVRRRLLPLAAVLAALCLVLSLSCLVLSLLHGYYCLYLGLLPFYSGRGDWFLLNSRKVRHIAVGLFCCGVSVYLAALSLYMLVLFEIETGITTACILSSGIVVLFITVTHTLIRASRASRDSQGELSHTLYENDSAHGSGGEMPSRHHNSTRSAAVPRVRPETQRECLYPPFLERKSQLTTSASSNVTSSGSPGPTLEKRMHRTLSAESGLLQVHRAPWQGVPQEMQHALPRKQRGSRKDSTLV